MYTGPPDAPSKRTRPQDDRLFFRGRLLILQSGRRGEEKGGGAVRGRPHTRARPPPFRPRRWEAVTCDRDRP